MLALLGLFVGSVLGISSGAKSNNKACEVLLLGNTGNPHACDAVAGYWGCLAWGKNKKNPHRKTKKEKKKLIHRRSETRSG